MAQTEDRRRITVRLTILQVSVVVVFAALGISFWFLQIVQHSRFEEMAENNHQRTLALRAPRGVLFDRNGTVLVENRHSFTISIVREHSKNLEHTVALLSAVAHLDAQQVQQIVDRHRNEPSYRPIVVAEDPPRGRGAAAPARRPDTELPGGVGEGGPARRYPAEAMAAHLFGYVGQANDAQVEAGATQGAIVGQQGLEKAYN